MTEETTFSVERRSIDVIPDRERHGSVRSLFTVWFGANMQVTAIVTGALAPVLHVSVPWALLAILLGNLFGAVFMALHSAQGPKLGIPQMIQSRAQFGFYGAILPLVLVVLMYIGFFASSAVLGGDALASQTKMNDGLAIAVVSAVCTVLAVYGYRLIHAYERWISLLSGLGFLFLTVWLLTGPGIGSVWQAGTVSAGSFLLMVAIAATWQITYAPYVADYSRYLPRNTSVPAAFWWTYAGSVLGTVWMMWFGAVAATAAAAEFKGGSVSFIVGLAPSATHWLFALIVIGGIVAANVLNLYGTFMSTTTTATALWRFRVTGRVRLWLIVAAAIVGTGVAIAGKGNFVHNYENFILFLAYFLIPWTAINLVDFYLVRRERYDMDSIFNPAGIYGGVNWRTMIAYLVAIAAEIPFVSSSFYTGPMVDRLGGADISWMIGLVVAAALYYALMRRVGAVELVRVPVVEEELT